MSRWAAPWRVSAGIDQTISPKVRVNASFQSVRGCRSAARRNLNAPVNGVRPDPGFANIIQTVSDAELHSDQLSTTLNVNFAGGVRNAGARAVEPAAHDASARLLDRAREQQLRRPLRRAAERLARHASGRPSPGDRRHRYQIALNSQAVKNLNASVTLAGNTGTPYNITTGFDDNNDSIFNDRPAGVGRNSVRTSSQATVSANLSYSIGVGGSATAARAQERPGGGGDRGGPGDGPLPAGLHGLGQQPDEPAELFRLQRHPDVTVLPDAHRRPESAQGGHRRRPALLIGNPFPERWRDGSCRLASSAASLLQSYRFLGYAALEDHGAVEIRDLDCIGRAERLAIRTHSDAG